MKRNTRRLNARTAEQVFSYRAPAALRVHLAADFTRWQRNAVPMAKGEDGVWRCKVRLAPGLYHYRFIVDGEWHDDPACALRIPNSFGTSNMVREVRSPLRRGS